jgi:cob(I)alamin adenosyltransferase
MPEGRVTAVPEDGLSTRERRALPLLAVHTGDGKGKSTAAFGLETAGLVGGMADRRVPVHQEREMARRRGGRAAGSRRAARRHGPGSA